MIPGSAVSLPVNTHSTENLTLVDLFYHQIGRQSKKLSAQSTWVSAAGLIVTDTCPMTLLAGDMLCRNARPTS